MRLPVDRNADLKKCLFCSNYINGQCEGLSVEITTNEYELIEGHFQEALKEIDIVTKIGDIVEEFVPKTRMSALGDKLEYHENDLLSNIADAVFQVVKNKLKISAKVSPDTEFYCKNWR